MLLGAMLVTKIYLAAMSRVDTPEAERKDFYLYVDGVQVKPSFVTKIKEYMPETLPNYGAIQVTYNFPEGMTGTHEFFGDWYCKGDEVSINEFTITMTFTP